MEPLLSSGIVSIHSFRRFVDDNIPATVGGNTTELHGHIITNTEKIFKSVCT